MFCNQFKNEGVLYVYDELGADDKMNFEAHLLNCFKCNSAIKQFDETRRLYRQVESEVPSIWIVFSLKLKSKVFQHSVEFKKFLSKLSKPKKVWIPVTVATIALILICLSISGIFHKKSNMTINQEEILEWTILSNDSINSLDRQIDEILAENFNKNTTVYHLKTTDSIFNEDLGLSEIQQDIIFLSWDINQSYF